MNLLQAFRVSVAIALLSSTTLNAESIRTVILSGDSPQELELVDNVRFFYRPVLNNSGNTAFVAFAGSIGSGIVKEIDEGFSWVARGGEPAPGVEPTPFFRFSFPRSPAFNNEGLVGFLGELGNSRGYWAETDNGLELVERAPFLYPLRQTLPFTDSGHTLFVLGGPIVASPSELLPVVQVGQDAPGVNSQFISFSRDLFHSDINNHAEVAFVANAFGDECSSPSCAFGVHGIWANTTGSLELVAIEGEDFDGHLDLTVQINDARTVAFSSEQGIWSTATGTLEAVVESGIDAPGLGSDVKFASLPRRFLLNATDQVAFHATLSGPEIDHQNDVGIWRAGTGIPPELLAREGDIAPGIGSDTSFGALLFGSEGSIGLDPSHRLAFNERGQVAFFAILEGSDVGFRNDGSLWASTPSGELKLIAREGELLEVAPDDFRRIIRLQFFGGSDNQGGQRSGFNDLGQLAFHASFADGSSGIFVSNIVAIPEPSTVVLCWLGWFSLTLTSRRFEAHRRTF